MSTFRFPKIRPIRHDRKLKNSPYFWVLLFFLAMPLISAPFKPPLLDDSLEISNAVILHISMSIFMLSGYIFARSSHLPSHRRELPPINLEITKTYVFAAITLSIIGLAAAVHSATYNTGIQGYVSGFVEASGQLREDFEAGSASGGVPGYIKLFGYAPLAVFLNISAILYFFGASNLKNKRLQICLAVSISCLILKTVFALDRLSLAAAGLVLMAFSLKRINFATIAFLIFVAALGDYVSRLRLSEFGLLDFLILYSKLGLQNLELLLKSQTTPSIGFETFLHPLLFILKFLGIPLQVINKNYDWAWNPAQYLFGYLYLDFSFVCIPVCFAIGGLLGYIEKKSNDRRTRFYSIYFVVLYGTISFLGVPAIRGLEFWFALCVAATLSHLTKRHLKSPVSTVE